MSGFPRLSLRERDRRWDLAQRLIRDRDLAALLVYGEPEGAGVPHFAADNYFTNDRTGGVVLIPRDEPPQLFAPVHLMVGGHYEAVLRGDDHWLEPGQFITHAGDMPAGAARGGAFIAACLHERGLATSEIGVVGLGAAAFHPDGIIPAGTWRELTERLPAATLVPADADFIALTRCLSDEERELVRWCGHAGEEMCAAIIDAMAPGVPETVPYAAGVAASLRAGAHNSGSVFVVAPGGESVEWGPPAWTYRAQPPRVLAEGDVVLAELFPVYGMRETQQQLTVAIGKVHPDTDSAAAAAGASYDAAIAVIRPGITLAEVVRAMYEPIEAAGGWNLTPLIHSLNPLDAFSACGLPSGQVPAIDTYGAVGGVPTVGGDLVLKAGMTFALEPNCVLGRRRVNVGGTVIVNEKGVEEVNTLPRAMRRI
ncbi:M24 family metallopeptidase [Actinomadura opuntiae]|uniref:M24 family metallopeptidase n=1 Tax=Actinomadura sp. OS1-43 TaxID=604315 RepID=UPI00255AC2C8|nr:M24 family metallopeptidase [Actinomadura sp. OS1-43]MDL4814117.1 M24 family metallopeptidase [Actinomadura sp. OS1-43]